MHGEAIQHPKSGGGHFGYAASSNALRNIGILLLICFLLLGVPALSDDRAPFPTDRYTSNFLLFDRGDGFGLLPGFYRPKNTSSQRIPSCCIYPTPYHPLTMYDRIFLPGFVPELFCNPCRD